MPEVNDSDLEWIADQIKQGVTSGYGGEDGSRIYWEIKINKWEG